MKRTAAVTFYVTAAATLSANVYASNHTTIGVLTGLWGPLALFLSLELVERSLRVIWARVAVGFLALVAGWVSYGHLVTVFTEGGADTASRYLLPLTVDVLMAISRVAMVSTPSPALLPREVPVQVEAIIEEPPVVQVPAVERVGRGVATFIDHRTQCTHEQTPAARKACREARRAS